MREEQDKHSATDRELLTPQQVRRLTTAMCDREPTPSEFASLQQSIANSDDARQAYLEVRRAHAALLSRAAQEKGGLDVAPTGAIAGRAERKVPLGPTAVHWPYLAVAVALLVMVPLSSVYWWGSASGDFASNGIPQSGAEASSQQRPDPVAQITTASDDCRLLIAGSYVNSSEPIELRPGEDICLITGAIYVRFTSGVQSSVLAPAVFTPRSPLSIEMAEGHLTADVGPRGSGFTVSTADAEVVDLGTVFGVSVSSVEGTEVVVFDGEVEISAPQSREDSGVHFASQRVAMGEGVEVGSRDQPSPLMAFACADYVLPQELLAQPIRKTGSVIASVSDNLRRGDQATYSYEIVSGGMREDAIAFADRGYHQWNGLTDLGMPDYLKGADFVRGFSNLKYAPKYEMYISVNQPANLYVLWDERVTIPAWLEDDFVNTGDKLGLDEGPHIDERHRVLQRKFPGLGPGRSIDQTFTIWKRVVMEPSTVTCGFNSRTRGHIQMYGVAVTPLDRRQGI